MGNKTGPWPTFTCTVCGSEHGNGCQNTACIIGFHNVASVKPGELEKQGLHVEGENDPLNRRCHENYELGQVVGLEKMGPRLRAMAGAAFGRGKDDLAKIYRDLAETFEGEAKRARSVYDKLRGRA